MKVKVCNFRSNDFQRDFITSIVNTGFAVITHHGVDFGLIQRTQSDWREFFLDDQLYKNMFINDEDGNMGYKGIRSEKAVGATKADLKEFYHWKPGKVMPDEVFVTTTKLYSQLEDVGMQILYAIDNHSRNQTNYAQACMGSDNTILRTLYYPAMDYASDEGAVRAAAHEDINFITLLVAASAPGLQVKDLDGSWHDVPHEENSIVVNVGDMLQLASKGLYRSTTHRVVNPEDNTSDRISMPLFIHPHSNTLLADGITAKQYLDERIAQIYGSK